MGKHTVVDAKNNLSDLIARAEQGEEVVITRHGVPVVEIRSLQPAKAGPPPMTQADLDWLDENRIRPAIKGPDSATLIRQMRDEGY